MSMKSTRRGGAQDERDVPDKDGGENEESTFR